MCISMNDDPVVQLMNEIMDDWWKEHSDLDQLTRILDISGTAYQTEYVSIHGERFQCIVIGDGWNAVQIKFDKDGKVCKR